MGIEMALNDRQTQFVAEYLVDFNATQAAIRAGYSRKTAGSQGFDLLKKPEIAEEIRKKSEKIQEKVGFTAEMVIQELGRAVFFDPRKLYNADGSLKRVVDLDDDTAGALTGFEVTEAADGVPLFTKKVKWLDKNTAITTAMKHFGLLTDKTEVTGKDGKDLAAPVDPQDLARRIAFLLAQSIHKES